VAVLAIHAGPGGVTATVVTARGRVAAARHQGLRADVTQPGRVERAPDDIWQATLGATREVLREVDAGDLTAIGVTGDPRTTLVWDRETLGSPRPAMTGPSGAGLAWLAEHEPHTWALVEEGRYAVGTVESYLVARMTRGTWHVTDASHAARTGLLDLRTGGWSRETCALLGIPEDALPELVPSWGEAATCEARAFLGLSLPVAGIASDRSAALFGQARFAPGDAACTYGDTTATVVICTGASLVRDDAALAPTIAWRSPDGATTYAVEGTVAAGEPGATAGAVGDLVAGRPRGTVLRVGGAGAAEDGLCRMQADRSGLVVERPVVLDTIALGAAFLAGLGSGVWSSTDDLREAWELDRRFEPPGSVDR
jgi:glycerol kinase